MIVFIRHGEKVPWDPVNLSVQGEQRARLLPDYFRHPFGLFDVPTALVAMADGSPGHSRRCTETLQPTADALGLSLQTWQRGHGRRAIRSICKEKTTVVCWEHSEIVDVVRWLGFDVWSWGLYPSEKDHGKHCFDATWVVNLKRGTLTVYRQFRVSEDGKEAMWPWPRTVPTCDVFVKRGIWARVVDWYLKKSFVREIKARES